MFLGTKRQGNANKISPEGSRPMPQRDGAERVSKLVNSTLFIFQKPRHDET
jgi:hypothetical protein